MNNVQITPSILDQTEQEFLSHVAGLDGAVEMVQIDIADGKFVPNTTWADPDVVQRELKIDCELHLMVAEPLKELVKWQKVEQVKRVLVHYEAVPDLKSIMPTLHAYGWEIGIVLNPDTPINVLDDYLSEIKAVMFMGVHPGFQGQKFIPETLARIKEFKSKNPDIFVEVDGAVNETTVADIAMAGADGVCPGSAIFGNDRTPKENVESMNQIINKLTE